MDLYKFSFCVLTAANAGLGYLQYRSSQVSERSRASSISKNGGPLLESSEKPPSASDKEAVKEFTKSFFGVYIFVVAADWLQGPYMYSLYKDEKGLSERATAILFACGFVSAAISASFVGSYADQNGRKQACLAFCVAYAVSCMSMIFNSIPILFLGRVLGGISTTLMYSVFETWMVHEFHAREMASKGMVLGRVFGWMTTVSSIVAVLSGVVGEAVVDWSGTKVAPFMAALGCLGVAFVMIANSWPENYGTKTNSNSKSTGAATETDTATLLKDKRIVSLGLICCLFEGTMYLFVFFWSAALKSARSTAGHESSSPPFGLVFATFMSAMMLGSQVFTITSSSGNGHGSTLTIASSVQTLSLNILLAAASLLAIVSFGRREDITLWAFCVFEGCVGLYYPSMGYLKGQIVHDGVRGKVYGLLRLPLNVFVVVTLGLTKEGDRHRDNIFMLCGALLVGAYMVTQRYLAT